MHPQLSASSRQVSPGEPGDPGQRPAGQRSRLLAGLTGVRFGPLAVVVSAIAHVGLMAGLATIDPPPPPPRVPPSTVAMLDRPAPPPIDVADRKSVV